jgi:hypothetical protein
MASTAERPIKNVPASREASLKFLAMRIAAAPVESSNRNLKEI